MTDYHYVTCAHCGRAYLAGNYCCPYCGFKGVAG